MEILHYFDEVLPEGTLIKFDFYNHEDEEMWNRGIIRGIASGGVLGIGRGYIVELLSDNHFATVINYCYSCTIVHEVFIKEHMKF